VIYTTSFHPPLEKYYFASVRGLAKSPPTVQSNCSKRMCLHARTFLVVALENRLSWLEELTKDVCALPSPLTRPAYYGRQNANTKLFLQLPMKFGDIVRVGTSRYLIKITTLQRIAKSARSKVLVAKHGRSLRFLASPRTKAK
jgi:hypothetical protein